MKHPCEGCVDAVQSIYGIDGMICNYCLNTGMARQLICPPGKDCTVKSTVPRPEAMERYDPGGYVVRRKVGKPEKLPIGEVRKMAVQGMSDAQIAVVFGVAKNTVYETRKRHNIPPGSRARGELTWKE